MLLRTLFASANLNTNDFGYASWQSCPLRRLADSHGFTWCSALLIDVGEQVLDFLKDKLSVTTGEARTFLTTWGGRRYKSYLTKQEALELTLRLIEEALTPCRHY